MPNLKVRAFQIEPGDSSDDFEGEQGISKMVRAFLSLGIIGIIFLFSLVIVRILAGEILSVKLFLTSGAILLASAVFSLVLIWSLRKQNLL